jgi:hypothetical protein
MSLSDVVPVRRVRATPARRSRRDVLPIPIRADLTVRVHGLPFDLTQAEARKVAAVIQAMAVPEPAMAVPAPADVGMWPREGASE